MINENVARMMSMLEKLSPAELELFENMFQNHQETLRFETLTEDDIFNPKEQFIIEDNYFFGAHH